MKYTFIIYIFVLFILLNPNVFFRVPLKNNLLTTLAHAIIFIIILYLSHYLFNNKENLLVGTYTENDDVYKINLKSDLNIPTILNSIFGKDSQPEPAEHKVIVNEIVDYSALAEYEPKKANDPYNKFGKNGVIVTLDKFISTHSPLHRLDIDKHVSNKYVFDSILRTEWNHTPQGESDVNYGKVNTAWLDNKHCIDLVSTNAISLPSAYSSYTLGRNYTAFYIWYPREDDSNQWRTLHRGTEDHLGIVYPNQPILGMYSNRSGGFKGQDYEIKKKWKVLIITGEQTSNTNSYEGTSRFYINDESNNDTIREVTSVNRVASGTGLKQIGWIGQAPGYFKEIGLLNQKLTDDDRETLMNLLVAKMNKPDDDYEGWVLVSRQKLTNNNNDGFWDKNILNDQNNMEINKNNPGSNSYLMNINELNTTQNYKSNGKFKFKYVQKNPDSKEQIWLQNNNPFEQGADYNREGTVPGYEAININYNSMYWGGLRYNGNQCLVSGSSTSWWFYSIGSFGKWGNGMPGVFQSSSKAASEVELYVWRYSNNHIEQGETSALENLLKESETVLAAAKEKAEKDRIEAEAEAEAATSEAQAEGIRQQIEANNAELERLKNIKLYQDGQVVFNEAVMTFEEHLTEAQNQGGNLVSILSEFDGSKLYEYFPQGNYWIGARRKIRDRKVNDRDKTNATWEWTDGSFWNYQNFYPGQPDNVGGEPYLYVMRNTKTWNDINPTQKFSAVYKIPYNENEGFTSNYTFSSLKENGDIQLANGPLRSTYVGYKCEDQGATIDCYNNLNDFSDVQVESANKYNENNVHPYDEYNILLSNKSI